MKVSIALDQCQGHSLCHLQAPEVFDLDEVDGFSVVRLPDGTVPPELEAAVRTAAAACPERAIIVRP
ncbi:MAG: ferredoxin [Frankiales bacterium]|nr:ferredoxin [Frankiales bacterium]